MSSIHYRENIFGLLDCNNFFVSCERVFQPKLNKAPVVVLSNNDGCVVSRSNEVKALNIKMGVPLFKIKELVAAHKIRVFSSNFALYGDMSRRVMESLSELVPTLEIYSIDEAFLDLTGFSPKDLAALGKNIVKTIHQWTGIPISLGIAPTKTLSKVANRLAKKNPHYQGVVDIAELNIENVLKGLPVEEVWGIGHAWAEKLNQLGIRNAYQLSEQDPILLQKRFNRVLATTAQELKGIPVYGIEEEIPPRKQIIVSRSFGQVVTQYSDLREALATHATRALEKLRDQGSLAQSISVFVQTCRFTEPGRPYHHHITVNLPIPSQDTRVFLKAIVKALNQLFVSGFKYKKAGVILMDISPKSSRQLDLFFESDMEEKSEVLMGLLDDVNGKVGQGSLRFALEGYQKQWRMRSLRRSPCYTTDWSQLLRVKT